MTGHREILAAILESLVSSEEADVFVFEDWRHLVVIPCRKLVEVGTNFRIATFGDTPIVHIEVWPRGDVDITKYFVLLGILLLKQST